MNCIVAQSGGPTAVINASVYGIYDACKQSGMYQTVYAGRNGVEGILKKNIISLTDLDDQLVNGLMFTPSSGLGSCRYKLTDPTVDETDYLTLFSIFQEYDIQTFFYIGGNDSMDTVNKLSRYAREKSIPIQIIGVPKTIDNDLPGMDHTPGFGSAVKLISTVALETYLDHTSYTHKGVFILETMGRDTGWLASAGAIATLDGKCVVDYIYLPERPFSEEQFLEDVERKMRIDGSVFIVASEGIRDAEGRFVAQQQAKEAFDQFNHVQLGGVCHYLKSLVQRNHLSSRVKTLELGVLQRCSMHSASLRDIQEAYEVGKFAVLSSGEDISGSMSAIQRLGNHPYRAEIVLAHTADVANRIKYFPDEWINERGNHVTPEASEYLLPLIKGHPEHIVERCIPKYVTLGE